MQKKQLFSTLVLVSIAVVIQGCVVAAVGAGAGTVAYIRGDLRAVEAEDLNSVYKATEKAMGQLELNVSKTTKDAMSAMFVARDSQDKKIKIKLSATAEGTTQLSIRVGTFGDETKARLIYKQVRKNL